MIKTALNLFAGLGGNRKLWPENVEVTAVENDEKIATVYSKLFPQDRIIIGNAYDYLEKHFNEFDFVWSSPPCQSHTRLALTTKTDKNKKPDQRLFEQIKFLQTNRLRPWIVENVKPYYTPPILPTCRIDRHLFWSNFFFLTPGFTTIKNHWDSQNATKTQQLKNWLGIQFNENLYYDGNHCPAQVLRNCVHPKIGEYIFNQAA